MAPDPPADVDWHLFAEGGFVMVHSYFGSNPAYLTTRSQGTRAGAPVATQETPFTYTVDFGPRVTLGAVQAGGLGFRASWWRLEESDHTLILAPPGPSSGMAIHAVAVAGLPGFTSPGPVARQLGISADQLAFDNHVHLEVWDAEVFQSLRGGRWALLLAGGARYGYLSENYRALRINSGSARSGTTTINLIEDSDLVATGRNFEGIGPTGALEVNRRLGVTGLSVYGVARGSVLFGHRGSQVFQRTVENQQTTVGSNPPRRSASSTVVQGGSGADETLPLGDFEVGVSWTVEYGRVLLFLQAGLVDETWFGAGSATHGNGNTGFYGLRLTGGFNF